MFGSSSQIFEIASFSAWLLVTISACADGIVPAIQIDEEAVHSELAKYRDEAAFDEISQDAYPSALPETPYVDLYADVGASTEYAMVHPETSGSKVLIPEGGIIVREILDDTMTAQHLTVMVKGPAG